jgi:ribosomal protein S18 acetylase RimI-like enzyme
MGVDSCFLFYLFSNPFRFLEASSDASECSATGSEIEIRSARARDLPDITEILVESFFPARKFWFWTRPIFRLGIYEDLRGRLNSSSPHYRCVIAIAREISREETIIATAEIGIKTGSLLGKGIPYISNLAVLPAHRRRGIARTILRECERVALEWGFDELSLHVLDNNLAARELYFSNGYRLQKVDGQLSAWLFDKPKRLFLHKKLER